MRPATARPTASDDGGPCWGDLDRLTAELDAEAVAIGRVAHRQQALAGGVGEIGGEGRERQACDSHGAVGGDLRGRSGYRVANARKPGRLTQESIHAHPDDGRLGAGPSLPDHVDRLSRALREARRERVGCGLELRARRLVVGRPGAAECGGERERGHECCEPGAEDQAAAAEGDVGEACEPSSGRGEVG
jgi:hypothetical protein